MADPVIVIGGGLAGLAAAARLAKAGHAVAVFERSAGLGGRWAPYALGDTGVLVDDAPSVLGFPAPWRDLFRKSGRPLEAELSRSGYELAGSAAPTYVFADGAELVLPTDRGAQFATVAAAYGRAVAECWRDLLDRLDDLWQTLRPLGFELELHGRQDLSRTVRRRLLHRRSLADLADEAGHPHLRALVRSVAYRQGSTPEQTPALAAVDLSLNRTFGRWQVQPLAETPGRDAGRSSVLIEALAARLALRRVAVHLGVAVTGVLVQEGRAVGVSTATGDHPAAAVINTTDPWVTARLLPRGVTPGTRRLRPASAPAIRHQLTGATTDTVSETTRLSVAGVPVVTYCRPAGRAGLHTVHDFGAGGPDPGDGLAWRGFRSWWRRPPISTRVAGLYSAGPFSAAGPGPSPSILSGALASYAGHDYVSAQPS